jgi:protein-L-isoaspartate(D-aspartate) O-methyltransferase
MTGLRDRYLAEIRRNGAPLGPALARAFATVPRELFVADGFRRRDGSAVAPGDADYLDQIYRDDVLVTKVEDGMPVSSSSQPSLMAIMLAALDVRPGMRVLEIGAGTGYNAALLAALGAEVISVDVQADVAERARAALARAGVTGVRVVHGDGYAGAPAGRVDRIIVTVGVAGVAPAWLAQLAAGGTVIAPVQHAGMHPVLAVRGTPAGPVTATVVCPSGFMTAAGPLTAAHPYAHPAPAPAGSLVEFAPAVPARWDPPLGCLAYRDLWYAAGAWHLRATHAALGTDGTGLALLDESRTGGALILASGAVLAGGADADRYAAAAAAVLDRWVAAGCPALDRWRVTLALSGRPDAPIWVPARWALTGPRGVDGV